MTALLQPDTAEQERAAVVTGMSAELSAAIERARHHKMTPAERFEQRVSFVFGQQDHDDPAPRSKDQIRQMLIDLEGSPSAALDERAAVVRFARMKAKDMDWSIADRMKWDELADAIASGAHINAETNHGNV